MTERKPHLDTVAVRVLVACCAFWGLQQILIKTTVAEVPPMWQASLRMAGAVLLLNGLGASGFSVMQATLVYLAAPPELRSRVLGILSVCIGLGPIGFVHIGLLAEAVGPRAACVVSALEGLAALALTRRWWGELWTVGEGKGTAR